jgi:signal transduction histidine kinase
MFEPAERVWDWCWRRADQVAAVLLTGSSAVVLATAGLFGPFGATAGSACLLAFDTLVAWRRRWPVLVAAAAGALVAAPELTRYTSAFYNNGALSVPALAAVFLYSYALGSHGPWKLSLLGLAPLTAGVALAAGGFNPFIEMTTLGPWLGGVVVASRRRVAQQLQARGLELEEERETFAAESVRYERARVARELHDIVAHWVSLIVVQASAGERLASRDPNGAAEAFVSISEAASQAEAEIDRLVELLACSPSAVPTAGLRIVQELVDRARAPGLRLSCQFSGDSDDLSEPAAEATYRLVQEAITNVMKHAPGAPVQVAFRGLADAVEVEVVNQPGVGGSSGLEGAGGGHGLAGMRERIARCGGSLVAGPTSDGGWRITACLPRHPQCDPTAGPLRTVPWA